MGLPIYACPRGEVTLPDGQVVAIRGLSRAEALMVRALGEDVGAVEKLCIRLGVGGTPEEVDDWYEATSQDVVELIVNAIARLSGLDPDQGKAGAEPSRSGTPTPSITSSQNSSVAA